MDGRQGLGQDRMQRNRRSECLPGSCSTVLVGPLTNRFARFHVIKAMVCETGNCNAGQFCTGYDVSRRCASDHKASSCDISQN